MKKVLIAIILILAAYLLIQGVRCHSDLRKAGENWVHIIKWNWICPTARLAI